MSHYNDTVKLKIVITFLFVIQRSQIIYETYDLCHTVYMLSKNQCLNFEICYTTMGIVLLCYDLCVPIILP